MKGLIISVLVMSSGKEILNTLFKELQDWKHLSTVLDDYSRYILSWKLCTSMTSKDAAETLQLAMQKTGFDNVKVKNRPRLLSDNGSSYV